MVHGVVLVMAFGGRRRNGCARLLPAGCRRGGVFGRRCGRRCGPSFGRSCGGCMPAMTRQRCDRFIGGTPRFVGRWHVFRQRHISAQGGLVDGGRNGDRRIGRVGRRGRLPGLCPKRRQQGAKGNPQCEIHDRSSDNRYQGCALAHQDPRHAAIDLPTIADAWLNRPIYCRGGR
jgi:hypothetical protein